MWIGFSAEDALLIADVQVIDCMEELDILTDGGIKTICKVIRRPGGINPITNFSNLRIQDSLRAKNNMKLSSFFVNHKVRTRRVAVSTDITLDNVRILCELKESKKEHKYPVVSLLIDAKSCPKNM